MSFFDSLSIIKSIMKLDDDFMIGNCSHSKLWLKQERQDWRTHQLYQFLKGIFAIAFGSIQDSG